MSGPAVEATLYMLDEAFEPLDAEHFQRSQSLLPNLAAVSEDAWCAVPSGASRSIRDIVMHVGACKYVYDNYAFGDGTLTWESKLANPWPGSEPHMSEVLDWVRAGHRRLRHHIEALDDEGLAVERKANWGKSYPTRWLVNVVIQHDLYHAGEINHIRSLFAGDDRWAHERELAAR
jgi:uncharacterized damage-inducible protein DinB